MPKGKRAGWSVDTVLTERWLPPSSRSECAISKCGMRAIGLVEADCVVIGEYCGDHLRVMFNDAYARLVRLVDAGQLASPSGDPQTPEAPK
jgi:hypothetical protein